VTPERFVLGGDGRGVRWHVRRAVLCWIAEMRIHGERAVTTTLARRPSRGDGRLQRLERRYFHASE
jgi:hypothetical protein